MKIRGDSLGLLTQNVKKFHVKQKREITKKMLSL